MDVVCQAPCTDGLTQLLSRLPMELRLQIYRLSLPLTRHRKRRVDVDFLADISWSASSQPLFDEIGFFVLRESIIAFHTSLPRGGNLVRDFDVALDRAFSGQAPWTLIRAHPMLARIKIIVKCPFLYAENDLLMERLELYLEHMKLLSNLEEVQISLAPETLPQEISTRYGAVRIGGVEKSPYHFPFLDGLRRGIANIQDRFPPNCRVTWRFDRAGMPEFASGNFKRSEAVRFLEILNEYADELLAQRHLHLRIAAELADACCWKDGGLECTADV